jgi:hypothetical protein
MKFATPDIAPLDQYDGLIAALDACSEAERIQRMRYLARTDLFFLVRAPCPAISPRAWAASYSSAKRRLASASISSASAWERWTLAISSSKAPL